MHVFFGDDSIRKGMRGGMGVIVAFGGVLMPVETLRLLQRKVADIRAAFSIPKDEELKWSPRRDSWIYRKLHGPDRTECYRQVLKATREAGATAFVVCFDRGRRQVTEQVALRNCIDWCFERVTMCLQDRASLGLIVCDRPGGGKREEDKLLTEVISTIEKGTEFVSPSCIPLNILTTPSHLVSELQIADLVAGVTTAMVAGETAYAEPLFEEIIPMFHKNSAGYAGGAGLKLFPNALLNLHYWVSKEDTFWKVHSNAGWTLPWWSWPYATSGTDASRLLGPP